MRKTRAMSQSTKFTLRRVLNAFSSTVRGCNPSAIIASVAELHVCDPVHCDCDGEFLQKHPLRVYLHENHRSFNRDVYERILRKLFPELRQFVESDSGKTICFDYAHALVKHFLLENPLQADWI